MAYLTPGVYVEEKSSGEKPIAGVGTGTGGFVGITRKGPAHSAQLVTSWAQYLEVFGGYVADPWRTPYAVEQFFKEGGSKCYVVRVLDIAATEAVLNDYGGTFLSFQATSKGSWGNLIEVEVDAATNIQLAGGFKLMIYEDGELVELFDNTTLATVVADTASSKRVVVTAGAGPVPTLPVAKAPLAGGDDGTITTADYIGVPTTGAKTGMYAFDPIDGVNMIAMPDIHFIDADAPEGQSIADTDTMMLEVTAYCENRKDCFYVADVPAGLSPSEAQAFKLGTYTDPQGNPSTGYSSSYAALYYPWVNATFGGKKVLMPPSAAVMGMISRTDANRGVFKAPAGVIDGKLRSVSSLEVNVSHKEQEDLNPYGVNVIRNFAGPGNVVWGARTCAAGIDPEWHYINVRRYFMYVEETLDEASQWVVFEPNTPALWGSVKRNIVAFLTTEWRNGALFGSTPEEAFYVTVDSSNNTPDTISQGKLIIEIGIAPVKPAEFVIIRISQKTLSA